MICSKRCGCRESPPQACSPYQSACFRPFSAPSAQAESVTAVIRASRAVDCSCPFSDRPCGGRRPAPPESPSLALAPRQQPNTASAGPRSAAPAAESLAAGRWLARLSLGTRADLAWRQDLRFPFILSAPSAAFFFLHTRHRILRARTDHSDLHSALFLPRLSLSHTLTNTSLSRAPHSTSQCLLPLSLAALRARTVRVPGALL